MQVLRVVLITFWSVLCLSGFYVLIKGEGSLITLISILGVFTIIFVLNNKGGELVRKVALINCGIFIISQVVFLVADIGWYFESAVNPLRILFFVTLLLIGLLTFAFLTTAKQQGVSLSDE